MFSQVFSAFLEFGLIFEHFEKKITVTVDVFRKLQTGKDVVRQMAEKSHFRRSVARRHCKRTQTMLKYEGHHCY